MVFDYGLPTAVQIQGLSAEGRDFHGFDFYGEFEIVLRLDDHRSRRISHEASAPWYAYFPVDLVVEFLLPIFPIRDVHRVDAKLEKAGKIDEALRKDLDARVEAETRQGPGNKQTR